MANENTIKTVAVYLSSRDMDNPVFKRAACDLGHYLTIQNYQVVFGGLFIGLMGDFARAVLDNNGQLTGYLPKNLVPYANKVNVPKHYEEHIVETVDHSRALMFKKADAAIALPGGFGTNVEICGFVEQQYLLFYENVQKLVNPMILFNLEGFYDGFFQHIARQVKEGSVNEGHSNILQTAQTIDDVGQILSQPLKPANDYSTDIKIIKH
jgi:uncharacterized protein (TIGR00730 family)